MDRFFVLLVACVLLVYFIKDILIVLLVLALLSYLLHYSLDEQTYQKMFGWI